MAAHFGHPTLGGYLSWLRDTHDIWFQSGCSPYAQGMPLTKILCKGRPVHIVGLKQTDRLSPSQVSYYDRRIGVKSPWGLPDEYE